MTEIDRIQYGRLLASVDRLTDELRATREQIGALDERLEEVEGRFRLGKGAFIGVLLALGAGVIGLREFITGFFGGK